MAKKSVTHRNIRRQKLAARHYSAREALKKIIRDTGDTDVVHQLDSKRRDQSKTRVCNRCSSCGRPRGVYKKFGLCRICLRIACMKGYIPGMRKASW